MIELCQHDHDYLAICRHYQAIFTTPSVQEDEIQWKDVRDCVLILGMLYTQIYKLPAHQLLMQT